MRGLVSRSSSDSTLDPPLRGRSYGEGNQARISRGVKTDADAADSFGCGEAARSLLRLPRGVPRCGSCLRKERAEPIRDHDRALLERHDAGADAGGGRKRRRECRYRPQPGRRACGRAGGAGLSRPDRCKRARHRRFQGAAVRRTSRPRQQRRWQLSRPVGFRQGDDLVSRSVARRLFVPRRYQPRGNPAVGRRPYERARRMDEDVGRRERPRRRSRLGRRAVTQGAQGQRRR